MAASPPDMRFRATQMEFAAQSDGVDITLHIRAADETSIAVECDPQVIADIQRQIAHLVDLSSAAVTQDVPVNDKEVAVQAVEDIDQHASSIAASDVSERIKAQRENVESRRIFADLFDNSDAAIIDYDFSALFQLVLALKRDGVRNLRAYITGTDERREKLVDAVSINNANAAALRMLGVSSLRELGKQSTNIIDIAEAMFEGETRIRRSEYLVAGGTPIPVVYSLRIPRTEEEARRVPIVIMDLSDIRLAEAARQATVAKSQFLSSMSHEIRTPLNGVISNLELLALTNLDSEQFELIDDADKAAKALLGLVGNILDFSKIEAGKLTTEMGDVNPAALVGEAVDVLQSLGRQKKIFVATSFGPDVPILVRGDAMRIRQILLNLIGNAVKFTEQGGVQVSLTVTAWDHEVCELRFDVQDSGRGFDQLLAAKLFETFIQDRQAADGAEGTGLGLSICKSLVEAFGGTIGCEGTPGEGATFWFTLPVSVVRRAPPVARPDLSGVRVMLIGECANGQLEDYFTIRGATVTRQPYETMQIPAMVEGPDAATNADIAVVIAAPGNADVPETAWQLRERRIVPVLYGEAKSPCIWLRQGFAAVIGPQAETDFLDRNMLLLVGHAQIRDRLAAQQAAVISAFGPALLGTRILVLEDRLVNQTVIQKQLRKLGIDCALAVNGIKGLEAVARESFDLILCDCSMPEMNGYDFTRALRRQEMSAGGNRHVPVIALTANAFREDADRCFDAGMDDFISKPMTMDRLAAVLARWLKSAGHASPVVSPAISAASPQAVRSPAFARSQTLPVVGKMMSNVIDMAALTKILGTSEPSVVKQILGDFLATGATSLSQIDAAILIGDPDKIRAAAHGAKGEARCAAATDLAEIYAELDRTAMGRDLVMSRALAERAAIELHQVETFIRAHLRRHGSA